MMAYEKIIDISLPLSETTITYPGNPEIKIKKSQSSTGNTLSQISFGSHTGTHIDAPSHCISDGKTLDKINLSTFIGECRVLDLAKAESCITVEDLNGKNIKKGERILLKTSNSKRGFSQFYPDFIYLSSEASEYLANIEVTLVGIDSLSIKQKGSSNNTPHTNLLSKGIPIIEGLNLSNCSEGEYFLVALPLNFIGLDGSPARVILLKDKT